MAIGFIGLGNIGKPMALQLLKLGEAVHVYDVAAAPLADLAAAGAVAEASPGSLAERCRHVGLCVRDDRDVEALLYGDEGLFAKLPRDSIIAVHSTVTQAGLLRWADEAARRELHLVDAPISGGASGAAAGTLATMVGASPAILERCRPVFAAFSKTIVHAGNTGTGIALKLCNNLMTYAAFSAMHEAAALAAAGGLALDALIQVGRSNGVVTPQMEAFIGGRTQAQAGGAEVVRRAFGPFAALAQKDLAAALDSGEALQLQLPVTRCVAGHIEDAFMGGLA